MPSPQSILTCLFIGAIGAAGILNGLYEKTRRAPADAIKLESRLSYANEEIAMLKRENESLRSLAHGGGKITAPPDFIARTEREFGLKFLTSPLIHRTAPDALKDRITAAIESRFGPAGVDDRQLAYSLIGWLQPDEDLLSQLAIAESTDKQAWLDEATGEGWMLDKTNLKNIPDQAALISLLAQILLHQNFPPPPAYPGDDAHRARTALHFGTAAGAESRFLTEQARTRGFMPMTENKVSKQLLASLSPFVRELTNFTNIHGKGFSDALHVRGNEALHTAFRHSPPATHTILHPEKPDSPSVVIEPPAHLEAPFLTESAGQLGFLLWVKQVADAEIAQEISLTWVNDRYFLFPDGEEAAAVLWDIELDSSATAERLETSVAPKLSRRNPDRHLSIHRLSPTRLRFLNTATAESTAKLRGP